MRKTLLALAVLFVGLALWAAHAVWRTFPRDGGTVRVSGHAAPIRIEFDAYGVPTIRAQSIPDAMFGLGYVHAKDRLWQMEFQRRVGAGRLAEILGAGLVPADRFLRTVGFLRAAESSWNSLSPQTKRWLEAYAGGVAAFLESSSARPIEFRLLRVAPEPWRPVDSLVWAKMMAWDLAGNAREEIRRSRFAAAVGPDRAAELLPTAASEPSILTDEEWKSGPAAAPPPVSRALFPGPWSGLGEAFAALDSLGFGGEDLGSNAWVIAGTHTASGRPILANDPHLGLRTPSVWYLASIQAPGYAVTGATLPGVPGVVIGHNNRIAWGLTSIEPDVQDLFVEDVDPRDASRYRHRGQWRSLETRTETIRVRSGKDVTLAIRSSVHGPIVSDVLDGAEALGPAVALRWAGLDDGDRTAEAIPALGTARNWDEFLAAVRLFQAPPQNFVYADVEGHVGYTASGAIPIRPRSDGLLPVSGAGEDDWTGTIPFEKLPRVLDPPRGFVATANNRVVSGAYPYSFGLGWGEPYRAKRITQMIESKERLDAADVAAMQLDRRSLQAEELLPLLLGTVPPDAASKDALDRLRGWDCVMAPESVPAAIYAAWFVELAKMPQDELKDTPRGRTRGRFLVNALREGSPWCDDVRTPKVETCADFQAASLKDAVAFLKWTFGPDSSTWRWQRLHHARFPHDVFDKVRLLRRLFDLDVGQGGDGSTVNVGGFSQDGSFDMTDGPSYRQVIDLSDLSKSRYVHTTGQSGNVFDSGYRDLLQEWRAGRYFEIGGEKPVKTLVLEP
ncbi:MAG: penicillin acylase family protein [Acidobacteriota bacterium]